MKKAILSIYLLFLLMSCTTSDVMSFSSAESSRLFIRPTEMKGEYVVKTDINIPCDDLRISGDATVNYSVFFQAGTEPDIRSALLEFTVDGETFTVNNPHLMFLESAGGKRQEARFTSALDAESMKTLTASRDTFSASLVINERTMPLNTSKLSKALRELSLNLL